MGRVFLLIWLGLCLTGCQTMPIRPDFTARQVAVLKQNGFEPAGENWQFGMADRLLFATDESVLIPEQRAIIGRIASTLLAVDIHGARVEGHTDSTGTAAYNDALSLKRAQAVAEALSGGGMSDGAIRAAGLGARIPVDSNHTADGRRENRRVVIIISPMDATPPLH